MKNIIYKSKQFILILYCYLTDFSNYIKYSWSSARMKEKLQASIMLTMHSLEKGFTFSTKKNGWGESKAKELLNMIEIYHEKYNADEITNTALSILHAYFQDTFSSKNKEIKDRFNHFINKNNYCIDPNLGGVKSIFRPTFGFSYDNILEFYSSRNSVRDFSDNPISEEEIKMAKIIAQTTPSACNRQASRLYVFQEKNKIKEILDNQLGDQGWCSNANTLFVITAHQTYFRGTYERYEALIDGGMYAMNFAMGLHAQKIATCFKMFIRETKREKEFKKITNIDGAELPIVLLLAGHYPNKGSFSSPKSHRINH